MEEETKRRGSPFYPCHLLHLDRLATVRLQARPDFHLLPTHPDRAEGAEKSESDGSDPMIPRDTPDHVIDVDFLPDRAGTVHHVGMRYSDDQGR